MQKLALLVGIASILAACGQTRTTDTQGGGTFPAGDGGPMPDVFQFVAEDGEHYFGSASIGITNDPAHTDALLYIIAESKSEPRRRWSAQLTIGLEEMATGSVSLSLRPYSQRKNEGFVDDASGPAPLFSNSGTVTLTFQSGRGLSLNASTDAKALNGTGRGKFSIQCSTIQEGGGTVQDGYSPGQPSPGTVILVPDPQFSTPFCAQFRKYL